MRMISRKQARAGLRPARAWLKKCLKYTFMNKDKKCKRKRTITLGIITPATRNKLFISNFKIRYQICNVKALPRDRVANTSNSIQLMSSPEQIKSTSRVCIPPDHRHINVDVDVTTKSHTTGCNIKDKATQYRNLLQTKHKLHMAIRLKTRAKCD